MHNNSKQDVMPQVEIYTDGACDPNPGPGGYAAVLLHPQKRAETSGGFRLTTNNRMEIYCPKCQATYDVDAAKRMIEQPASLFDRAPMSMLLSADGHDFLVRCEATQFRDGPVGATATVMWMHAGGRKKSAWMSAGDLLGFLASRRVGAGNDRRGHPGSKSAFDDLNSVLVKRAMRQIQANIDDLM
jgi:hypothetical protein